MGSVIPRIVAAAAACVALYLVFLNRALEAPFSELHLERAGAIAVPLILLLAFQKSARARPIGGGTAPYLASLVSTGGGHLVVFSVMLAVSFAGYTLSRRSLSAALASFLQQSLPLMAVMTFLAYRPFSGPTIAMVAIIYLALAVAVQEEGGEDRFTVARLAFADALWGVCIAAGLVEGTGMGLLALWSGVVYYSLLGALEGERKALSTQMSVARRTVETTRSKSQTERKKLTGLLSLQRRLDGYQETALKAGSSQAQALALQAALNEVTRQAVFAVVSDSGKILSQSESNFPVSEFLPLPSRIEIGRTVFSQDRTRLVFGLSADLFVLARTGEQGFTEWELAVVGHLLDRATLLLQLFGQRERLTELVEQKSTALEQLAASQRQLIQSGKMAAVGQLAAGVAHELNSPLAAIVLQADLGLRRLANDDPGGAKKCLEVCKKASRRAKAIIENLLNFSRVSKESIKEVCLRAALDESMELVPGQFDRIEIEIDVPDDFRVKADPNELQHIFTNIILNAHQALEGTVEPRLSIRCRSCEDRIQVRFSNNGPLIPDEIVGRLYEPFFTTKEIGAGTGLGLSLAYQICEKNGGRLWLEQDEMVHFLVELPRMDLRYSE